MVDTAQDSRHEENLKKCCYNPGSRQCKSNFRSLHGCWSRNLQFDKDIRRHTENARPPALTGEKQNNTKSTSNAVEIKLKAQPEAHKARIIGMLNNCLRVKSFEVEVLELLGGLLSV